MAILHHQYVTAVFVAFSYKKKILNKKFPKSTIDFYFLYR